MQLFARLCLIAFCAALGVAVAFRLTPEAMAVVVGIFMGLLASLPVALLVLYASRRQTVQVEERPVAQPVAASQPAPTQPQIVVLPAPQAHGYQPAPQWWPQPTMTMPAPAPRDFRIVGEDD